MATKNFGVYPCVAAHVTQHAEAAATAFESTNKGYKHRGSNSEEFYSSGITHASRRYDYSGGSSSHIQDKRRLDDEALCIP